MYGNTVVRNNTVSVSFNPSFEKKKHHGGFHIHGFRFAYKKLMHKQIIPHGRIPKKVATNYVSIHVNINNFIALKRFQVTAIKHVFFSALMEQQGPLLLCT